MTTTHTHSRVGADAFRTMMRSFATGVTIVATSDGRSPCGVTANAFATVSLAPPLVLVCLSATSTTLAEIARNGHFAVNVLSADQEALARRFASPARVRGGGAFDGVACGTAATGAPIIDRVAAWLDCRVDELHGAGDHVIAIGEVLALDGEPARAPLLFHGGRYRAVCDRDANPELRPRRHTKGGEIP
jgi:flavin reductase (DIM6/NTAB) family NADH-FMN oxidoreductase RutF